MEGNGLIHPVGDLREFMKEEQKARYGSSSVIDLSFTILIMEKMRLDYLQNLNFKDRF
jgi:hypothetical protein